MKTGFLKVVSYFKWVQLKIETSRSLLGHSPMAITLFQKAGFIFVLGLLSSLLGVDSLGQEPRKTDGHVHWAQKGVDSLRISVDKGFHINLKAPVYLKVLGGNSEIPPAAISEKQLIFNPPQGVSWNQVDLVQFYVCDDAKTVCEPHEIRVGKREERKLKETILKNPGHPELDKLLREALKGKKWVLLDFGASWCPACIRMEKEVLHQNEFKKLIKKNYLVYPIDVDKPENWELMKKFHVKVFPTLIIVNAKMEELSRFLDYQPLPLFVEGLLKLIHQPPISLVELEKKVQAGDRLSAQLYADSLVLDFKHQEADELYRKFSIQTKKAYINRINLYEKMGSAEKNNYEKALRDALEKYPEAYEGSLWKKKLAESLGDKVAEYKLLLSGENGALKDADSWIKSPNKIKEAQKQGELQDIMDLEIPELWALKAEIYEMMGDRDSANKAWKSAVEEVKKLSLGVASPTPVLYLVHYLKESGQWDEAEVWLTRLEKEYPSEFTYPHRHAKLFFEKKDFKQAEGYVDQAYKLSYGSNKITVGILRSRIYWALGKKAMAQDLLKELLKDDFVNHERNHRIKDEVIQYQKQFAAESVPKVN